MPRQKKVLGPTQKITVLIEQRVYDLTDQYTGDVAGKPSLAQAVNEGLLLWVAARRAAKPLTSAEREKIKRRHPELVGKD